MTSRIPRIARARENSLPAQSRATRLWTRRLLRVIRKSIAVHQQLEAVPGRAELPRPPPRRRKPGRVLRGVPRAAERKPGVQIKPARHDRVQDQRGSPRVGDIEVLRPEGRADPRDLVLDAEDPERLDRLRVDESFARRRNA